MVCSFPYPQVSPGSQTYFSIPLISAIHTSAMVERSLPPIWPFTCLDSSSDFPSQPDLQQEELRLNSLKFKRGLPFDPHLLDLETNLNTHRDRLKENWGREPTGRTGPKQVQATSERKLHTKHEDLKHEEIREFERAEFQRFQVPVRPPSKELCKEAFRGAI